MTRKEALKRIANLYKVEISENTSIGERYILREQNPIIDKVFLTYYLLLGVLYKNNARLKDVNKIHSLNNTIYFDLENMNNFELCDL